MVQRKTKKTPLLSPPSLFWASSFPGLRDQCLTVLTTAMGSGACKGVCVAVQDASDEVPKNIKNATSNGVFQHKKWLQMQMNLDAVYIYILIGYMYGIFTNI